MTYRVTEVYIRRIDAKDQSWFGERRGVWKPQHKWLEVRLWATTWWPMFCSRQLSKLLSCSCSCLHTSHPPPHPPNPTIRPVFWVLAILKTLWILHLLQMKNTVFYFTYQFSLYPRFPFDHPMNQHPMTSAPWFLERDSMHKHSQWDSWVGPHPEIITILTTPGPKLGLPQADLELRTHLPL